MKTLLKALIPPRILPPTAFIIGAQKAGTTPLVRYLAQHPEILVSSDKEVDFFGSATRQPLGTTFYHRHFQTYDRRKQVAIEASPHYLFAPHAARDLHAYNPQARILCLLRDPVSRAFSAYRMYQRFLQTDPHFFQKWNARYYTPEEQATLLPRPRTHAEDLKLAVQEEIRAHRDGRLYEWHLLEYGLYARNLSRYVDRFPREHILLLPSHDLAANTAQSLEGICTFFELSAFDWQKADLRKSHQETKGASPPAEARQLLEEFYQNPNEALVSLTNQRFFDSQ